MSGFAAVPGAFWIGSATPGMAVTGAAPAGGYVYNGYEVLVYPTYIDTAESHTLVATPGQSYQLAPPPGTGQPAVPDDGLWAPA